MAVSDTSKEKLDETTWIRVKCLPSLLFSDLIDRLYALEVAFCDRSCPDSTFPRDRASADVVLERRYVGGGIERHVWQS